jgi:hypothetical protein
MTADEKSLSGFQMKTFPPLGGASLSFSVGNSKFLKTANINAKTYQFQRSVKDDQIICQKLQISDFLILEIALHVT